MTEEYKGYEIRADKTDDGVPVFDVYELLPGDSEYIETYYSLEDARNSLESLPVSGQFVLDTLGQTKDQIKELIIDLNRNGAISDEYIERIVDATIDYVCSDLIDCADNNGWSDGDLRLAFGRAICSKLGIDF